MHDCIDQNAIAYLKCSWK